MKKLALLLLAAGLLFASCCYESLDDTAEYDIQVDNLFVSSMRSAISKNLGNNTSLSINIQFTGGYNDSKWKDVTLATLSGTIITFDSVPLGKIFDIWVGVYYGSELLYEASQKSIRLTSDTTELSLILKKLLNTQYVLYSGIVGTTATTYKYVVSNSVKATIPSNAISSTVNSFCFDSNGCFYLLNENGIVYSDNELIGDLDSETGFYKNTIGSYSGITIDLTTNDFYYYSFSDGNLNITSRTNFVSGKSPHETLNFSIGINGSDNSITKVHGKFVYTVCMLNDFYHLLAYSVPENLTPNSTVTLETPIYDVELSGFTSSFTVSDMIYQDGYIFILVNQESIPTSNDDNPINSIISRGCLIRVNLTTNKFDTLGYNPNKMDLSSVWLYAYGGVSANNPKLVYYSNTDSTAKVVAKASGLKKGTSAIGDLYLSSTSNSMKYFYSPKKFIAIKPKKLVIADDGIAVYTDGYGALWYKNANRVVSVDLEKFAITKSEDVPVAFDSDSERNLLGCCMFGGGATSDTYYKASDKTAVTGTMYFEQYGSEGYELKSGTPNGCQITYGNN